MKNLIKIFSLVLVLTFAYTNTMAQEDQGYEYAYLAIRGKVLTKKLKVTVDLGGTQEQIERGERFSEELTNRKSYASILNYMTGKNYELVETLDYTYTYQGSGGTSGVVFIMRKKKSQV